MLTGILKKKNIGSVNAELMINRGQLNVCSKKKIYKILLALPTQAFHSGPPTSSSNWAIPPLLFNSEMKDNYRNNVQAPRNST